MFISFVISFSIIYYLYIRLSKSKPKQKNGDINTPIGYARKVNAYRLMNKPYKTQLAIIRNSPLIKTLNPKIINMPTNYLNATKDIKMECLKFKSHPQIIDMGISGSFMSYIVGRLNKYNDIDVFVSINCNLSDFVPPPGWKKTPYRHYGKRQVYELTKHNILRSDGRPGIQKITFIVSDINLIDTVSSFDNFANQYLYFIDNDTLWFNDFNIYYDNSPSIILHGIVKKRRLDKFLKKIPNKITAIGNV